MDKKKTAILVIHGVGPHQHYQVCDDFARGFYEVYKNDNPDTELRHQLKQRKERVQSCVSLSTPDNGGHIDFYEYFWDIYMVHKVLPSEALGLLIKASKNAQKFYENVFKDDPDIMAKVLELDSIFFRKRRRKIEGKPKLEFRPGGYLRLLGGSFMAIIRIFPYLPFVLRVLEWWSSTQVPIISHLFKALVGFLQKEAEKNFMGDIVRYLDLDPRSKHYDTRQKIKSGAVEELRALMDDGYEQIIVAGHSLGSVIAYDALNRVILQANTGKIKKDEANIIKGLVTFGSPLDKIAFFFREYVPYEKTVQRKILADRHVFRATSLLEAVNNIKDPINFYKLPEVRWLNFYHIQDLISGKLDLYDLGEVPPRNLKSQNNEPLKDGNIRIVADMSMSAAHNCYWGTHKGKGKGSNQMYEDIVREFFQ